jgi:hypothetical protein
MRLDFSSEGSYLGRGDVAQQIFWYTAFISDLIKPDLLVVNPVGTPKWRVVPSPPRRLLEERHRARLPGLRLLDPHAEHPSRAAASRLALRPVLHLQDGIAQEDPGGSDPDPGERHQLAGDERGGAPKPKLEDEEGKGKTVDYDRLVQACRHCRIDV